MFDFNIITFHREYNYGALLQAYSLQSFIEEIGYSAGVYDYKPNFSARGMKARILKKVQGVKASDFELKKKKYHQFLSQKLHLNHEKNSRIYVAGSDQVWNPTGNMDSNYFLGFVGDNSAKVSYAASIGVNCIPENRVELFNKYLKDFEAISVREETAKHCISNICQQNVEVHVDPVLLHNADFWQNNMKTVDNIPEKYILVYLMHYPKNINKLLLWLKKETKLPIVLVDGQGGVQGRLCVLVKHNVALHNIGPEEFIGLIAKAEAVVTTSFHAVAFSMIFNKELYPIVGNSLSSRIVDLLKKVEFKTITENQKIFSRAQASFDLKKVSDFLKKEIDRSRKYFYDIYHNIVDKKQKNTNLRVDLLKTDCTGCGACASICPTNSIKMVVNDEGFYEPIVNDSICISCNQCGTICPQNLELGFDKDNRSSWYGWSKNSTLLSGATSGGAIPQMMEAIINEGGIVFSAIYSNNFNQVVFSDSDVSDIKLFRKSKYIASYMGDVYLKIKEHLTSGRKVMFSGAPCQVAGLMSFLKKSYDNLITCDFVCGGMPSETFWREHVSLLERRFKSSISAVDFRDKKKKGWGKDYLTIKFDNGKRYSVRSWKDAFYEAFYKKISLRENCLRCKYHDKHVADITVADFWGYKKANVNKNHEGMSLVVANSLKGKDFFGKIKNFNKIDIDNEFSEYAYAQISMNFSSYKARKDFFECARLNGFEFATKKYCNTSYFHHARKYIKSHFGI